jgi:Putative beta-barrel porin-2, OmpL-like. bbp2
LYAGVVNGFGHSSQNLAPAGENQTSLYVGGTLATPVAGLKAGAAFDYLEIHNWQRFYGGNGEAWSLAGYLSYQATEKLSLHGRAEYIEDQAHVLRDVDKAKIFEATATAQYDLWKNVISRLELRWDHSCTGTPYFGAGAYNNSEIFAPTRDNAFMLALNVIYKF